MGTSTPRSSGVHLGAEVTLATVGPPSSLTVEVPFAYLLQQYYLSMAASHVMGRRRLTRWQGVALVGHYSSFAIPWKVLVDPI